MDVDVDVIDKVDVVAVVDLDTDVDVMDGEDVTVVDAKDLVSVSM